MRLVTEKHHLLFFIYSAISCRDSVTTTNLIMVTKLLSSVLLMFHFELKYIFESANKANQTYSTTLEDITAVCMGSRILAEQHQIYR